MRVHIRLLGGFGVAVDGQEVPAQSWRRRASADLVKLLALEQAHRLRREQVVDALWPDLLLEDAAPRLHAAAHHARVALGRRDAVALSGGTVTLFPEAEVVVDAHDFELAARTALQAKDQRAAEAALSSYHGTLLPDDLYEPWTEEPRERLRLLHLDLLRSAGQYEEVVAADPLDEEAQLALVEHHLTHGRRHSALATLDRMAEVFRSELGVDPGPKAAELRRRAADLPVDLPADPVVPRQRRLPAPRNRLIGRDHDLGAVADLLHRGRLVTITGPGGAGKSTLALAVARHLRGETDHGAEPSTGPEVVVAELAPVSDPAHVTRAVAEAAGVQGPGALEAGPLAANLGPRPVLLLLDNCEHVLDAAAGLVDAILDAGTEARVLVTSREPLRVDGEAVHPIGSLGSDAAELFIERATAAVGAGVVTGADPRVVDLCARLDGLPLAVELAAAQLRHLTLADLVERLDERLTLLVGGRPRAGERHSALLTTIDWSYRLLSPTARAFFDRLGVFPADFDLDAVAAVTGSDRTSATRMVADLVAKNLVVHDASRRRYRLLETLRLFAAQQLETSGGRPEAVELLRRHVVGRARRVPRHRAWLSASLAAQSRDDMDNVRLAFDASLAADDPSAAIDLALAVSTLWRNAVSYTEGGRWIAALGLHDLAPPDRLWTALLTADIGLGAGDPVMLRDAVRIAAETGEAVDDPQAGIITDIYAAMADLRHPAAAERSFASTAQRAHRLAEPGLERLARAMCLVARCMTGQADGVALETDALVEEDPGNDYDRYISLWAASLVGLVDRDGARLRRLMDAQLADLMANGLRENWLTMYWQALALVAEDADYVPQLRKARRRAEAEGRRAEADCVLALAYAAACADRWDDAATLLSATRSRLHHDTASFVHHYLLREQLVRPRMDAAAFEAATEQGADLDLEEVLARHGL